MRNFLLAAIAASALVAAVPASAQVNLNGLGGYSRTQYGKMYVYPRNWGRSMGRHMDRDPDPFIRGYLQHDPTTNRD